MKFLCLSKLKFYDLVCLAVINFVKDINLYYLNPFLRDAIAFTKK